MQITLPKAIADYFRNNADNLVVSINDMGNRFHLDQIAAFYESITFQASGIVSEMEIDKDKLSEDIKEIVPEKKMKSVATFLAVFGFERSQ